MADAASSDDKSTTEEEEEDEEDPYDTRIQKTGCAHLHVALQVRIPFSISSEDLVKSLSRTESSQAGHFIPKAPGKTADVDIDFLKINKETKKRK